jgi:diguanylate cyclase (GGDEF)-like protein
VIIYEGYSKEQVLSLAEELKRSIVDLNIRHEHSEAGNVVTISQGICCDIPKEENKVWDYLHTADMMLYKGKKISRNSVHISNYEENTRQ